MVRALNEQYAKDVVFFHRLLRQRVPPRGERFGHDHPDTFLYIERSKNRNIVAYTSNLLDAATHTSVVSGVGRRCVVNSADPVHAYFITLEPSDLEKQQKKGVTNVISELTFIQRKLAYGCSAKPLRVALGKADSQNIGAWLDGLDPYVISYVALPDFPTLMLTIPPSLAAAQVGDVDGNGGARGESDTMVVLLSTVGGVISVLKHVYVRSVEPKHFYQLPRVEYIEVFGVALDSGAETYEKKENK